MGGVDTVRGINYQHCHAILCALDVLGDPDLEGIRVEGTEDLLDIEVHALHEPGSGGGSQRRTAVVRALQVKSRAAPYTWSAGEMTTVLRRWTSLPLAATAEFEFVTDAQLGPSAQPFVGALSAAIAGEPQALARLLGLDGGDPLCSLAMRASIRAGAGTVEDLLLEAEREVRSHLPGGRNREDIRLDAEAAVTRLFRLLALRAGLRNELDRFVTRAEIADVVGGVAGLSRSERWLSSLSAEYLTHLAALTPPGTVHPKLIRLDGSGPQAGGSSIEHLLQGLEPSILVGRTGSGKSTVATLTRQLGADRGIAVILCHAEAYLEGRLDSLVAEAIGAIVGRDIPRASGRQALGDPQTTVIIDGVSEVPAGAQRALAEELRPHVASSAGARVILLGRDEIAVSSVMPQTSRVARFSVAVFDQKERRNLALRILFPDEPSAGRPRDVDGLSRAKAEAVSAAIAQVEHALGDAAGNPLLLNLGLTLIQGGASFRDRSTLYSLTIDRMAARVGAPEIHVAEGLLGVMFARLLDSGRRYANPLEWDRLFEDATIKLTTAGVAIDRAAVNFAVRSSGVVNSIVSGIGHTQLRGPIHDSFADYLAGAAHATGLAPLPTRLAIGDEQRVLFTAEMAGVSTGLSRAVATAIPFTLVPLSAHDRRPATGDSAAEIEEVLGCVLPDDADPHVLFVNEGAHVVAQVTFGPGRRTTPAAAPGPLRAVCEPEQGPLAVAVRLWRLALRTYLTLPSSAQPRRPRSLGEARDLVETHAARVQSALQVLLPRVAPPQAVERLAAAIGPFGISATVRPMDGNTVWGEDWAVCYSPTEGVEVHLDSEPMPDDAAALGAPGRTHTLVGALRQETPEQAAAIRVREAINRLTEPRWL